MIASDINLGSVHFFVSSVTVAHDSFLWIEEALWMCCHVIKRLAWGQFICIREQITKEKWMELRETLLAFRHKYFVYILGCTIFFSMIHFFKKFTRHICIYFFQMKSRLIQRTYRTIFLLYVSVSERFRLPEILWNR